MGKNFDVNGSSSSLHLLFSFTDPSNYQVIVPKGNFSGRSISVAPTNLGLHTDKKKLLDSAVLSILSQIQRQYSQNTQDRVFTHVEIKMDTSKQVQISITDKDGLVETLKADAELSSQIFNVASIVNNSIAKVKAQPSPSDPVTQGVKETGKEPVVNKKESQAKDQETQYQINGRINKYNPINDSEKLNRKNVKREAEKKQLEIDEQIRTQKSAANVHKVIKSKSLKKRNEKP
jgi:hypothetical protein